jgi:hypothetical protein
MRKYTDKLMRQQPLFNYLPGAVGCVIKECYGTI